MKYNECNEGKQRKKILSENVDKQSKTLKLSKHLCLAKVKGSK